MSVLSELDVLRIDLAAVSACVERREFDPDLAPGEQMTDDDYRAGIREVFASEPDWEEWMIDSLLIETKKAIADRKQIMRICDTLLGGILR